MKKLIPVIALFALLAFVSCKDKGPRKDAAADKSSAVCLLDKASLIDKPAKNGKWLAPISLGEKLTYLEEKKEDETNKKISYLKVKLVDGKEGWVRSDFVAIGSERAVITDKTDIYSRPDLSTVTKNSFEAMDIIAVKSVQDDWTEIIGKRQTGKWIETAWVKSKYLSNEDKDIAAALYVRRAMAKTKKEDKIADLNKLRDLTDLRGSIFDEKIVLMLEELQTPAESVEEHEHEVHDSVGE